MLQVDVTWYDIANDTATQRHNGTPAQRLNANIKTLNMAPATGSKKESWKYMDEINEFSETHFCDVTTVHWQTEYELHSIIAKGWNRYKL